MNRNHLIGFAVVFAVLVILAFIAWSLFEIHPGIRKVPPSREARANEYLALDHWLASYGIPVRKESYGNLDTILQAQERHISIQASLFRWTEEAVSHLICWIEDGGHLFLFLDLEYYEDMDFWSDDLPLLMLEEFGIEAGSGTSPQGHRYDPDSPRFSQNISFTIPEESDALTVKDWTGLARLVRVKRGAGSLTVSGRSRFLLSTYIKDEPNARLAWNLFIAPDNTGALGANSRETGWLFIRGTTRVRGIWGSLFRLGNMAVPVVSALVLIVTCFWAVIPGFGLVQGDAERPGKPLRERFLAEGRFLKRYGALGVYRDRYIKEIKRRLLRKEGTCEDEEIHRRLSSFLQRGTSVLPQDICEKNIKYREFPRTIEILRSILERI